MFCVCGFVFVHLHLCIFIFVFVHLCICICVFVEHCLIIFQDFRLMDCRVFNIHVLEGTAPYGHLLLAPAEGWWPSGPLDPTPPPSPLLSHLLSLLSPLLMEKGRRRGPARVWGSDAVHYPIVHTLPNTLLQYTTQLCTHFPISKLQYTTQLCTHIPIS